MEGLLRIGNLTIQAKERTGCVTIVDNISFNIKPGQTVGVVGESGCGKSMTALAIVGLLRKKIQISNGHVLFQGKNLAAMRSDQVRKFCGKEIGFIFQEPMTALNPMFKIGRQLAEPMLDHLKLTKEEAYSRSIELLNEVGIKDAENVMNCYPHHFSGGMRQRVLIAMAISCNPKLLIADEPTTALDVITQAQILKLLKKLIKERNMALLLISHDLGVISQMSENVLVMYSGELIEEGKIRNIINYPQHPYTEKLISAVREMTGDKERLLVVKGSVPRPEDDIKGCKFSQRCEFKRSICERESPPIKWSQDDGGRVKCWKYHNDFLE